MPRDTRTRSQSPAQFSSGSSSNASVVASSQLPQLLPGAIAPNSVGFFHGKITREQAEEVLVAHGATEGLFLLRESVGRNFVISICHLNRVHHYNVERQLDGWYKIQTGRRFLGPVELIRHHSTQLDGFLTLARLPLNRADGLSPLILQGLYEDELEEKLRLKAAEMGLKGQSVNEALSGPMRDHLRYLVYRELHACQPWYHHTIRRREAERRIIEDGNYDGTFLVRFRKEDGTYVLSLCCQGEPKHYKIEEHLSRWSIEGGQYFETLMEMIDHYHHRQDGLLCKLRRAVVAPSFTRSRSGSSAASKFHQQGTSPAVEDTAVQTIMSSAVTAWNGSQSLPSLSSVPVVSGNLCPTQIVNGMALCSTTQGREDLISFADWPNVTRLLANQSTANGMPRQKFAVSLNPFPATPPFTPPTPVPNPLDITPTPATVNQTPPVFPKPLATNIQAVSANAFPAGAAVFPARLSLGQVSPAGSRGQTSSDVNPLSCLKPVRLSNPPVESVTAAMDAAIANVISSAFTPLPRDSSSVHFRKTNVTEPSVHGEPAAIIHPESERPQTGRSNARFSSQSDLPPHSLHYPPILDAPWEEPDCSGEHIQSPTGSGGGAGVPSLQTMSYPPSVPATSATSSAIPPLSTTNPFLLMIPPRSSVTGVVKQQQQQTPPLTHSPDVSTFCSAPCCCSADAGPKLSSTPASGRSVWANANCQDNPQLIYDELPPSNFLLSSKTVILKERLGGGNFGHVVKGIYVTPTGQEVPVAVKTLKPTQIVTAGERGILAEARTMAKLRHRHIVRLIGVCKEEQFMLVLELAPLGPINKYLRKRPDVPVQVLTELMHQVALGMAYLESCKFVHRDLAARNVLLVTRHFAKISDFGMSKALKFGSDYYRAATAGKWPLKWYAPECIYYFRFDSKSDVWSYGITLWEVYSYGERPYKDMKGAQILAMLDQGLRLSKPSRCPDSVYGLMQQCWNFEGVRRPTFAELVLTMSRILKMMPPPVITCGDALMPHSVECVETQPLVSGSEVMRRTDRGSSGGGSGGSGVNSGTSDGASM
ncbi:unnamed protein product [Calicophoron daubneyi]|uniref:Tyrosine-protein kinase n=1 Tax=Calicophoron daubneyi TaxID=300641 RepID=A0AAV2TMD0_CALDB